MPISRDAIIVTAVFLLLAVSLALRHPPQTAWADVFVTPHQTANRTD
ncbi:MAG: hypothetical protein V4804_15065 [Pseudomonadota bacterium]